MHGYHVQQPKEKKSVASRSQTAAIPAPFSYKPAKLTIPPVHRFLLHHQLFLSLPTNIVADQPKSSYTYSKGLHRRTCLHHRTSATSRAPTAFCTYKSRHAHHDQSQRPVASSHAQDVAPNSLLHACVRSSATPSSLSAIPKITQTPRLLIYSPLPGCFTVTLEPQASSRPLLQCTISSPASL